MKASKVTDEQIAKALGLAEAGVPVGKVRGELVVSERRSYRWKKRFWAFGVSGCTSCATSGRGESQAQRAGADLSLDKTIFHDVLREKR
jgi:hypothetical protein